MKSLYYIFPVLFGFILPIHAIAQEMVRIPTEGDKAIGYVPCAVDALECSPASLEKKTLKSFQIDSVPVTNADYRNCVFANKCSESMYSTNSDASDNKPVVVSFDEAKRYCEAVDKKLPTPEQWLAAAFVNGIHAYTWGDEYIQTATTQQTIGQFDSLEDVASFPKDQVNGIYDMSGNGYEWVDYPEMGEYPSGKTGSDAACIIIRSRMCMGAAPNPLYRAIGIASIGIEPQVATFRCVK